MRDLRKKDGEGVKIKKMPTPVMSREPARGAPHK